MNKMEKWYFVAGFYGQEQLDAFKDLFEVEGKKHVIAKSWLDEESSFNGFFRVDLEKFVMNEWIDDLFSWDYIDDHIPPHFMFMEIESMEKHEMSLKKQEEPKE